MKKILRAWILHSALRTDIVVWLSRLRTLVGRAFSSPWWSGFYTCSPFPDSREDIEKHACYSRLCWCFIALNPFQPLLEQPLFRWWHVRQPQFIDRLGKRRENMIVSHVLWLCLLGVSQPGQSSRFVFVHSNRWHQGTPKWSEASLPITSRQFCQMS